jgi:hypothetical protein
MRATLLVLVVAAQWAHADPEPRCAHAALKQAAKLLAFHFGPDDRIAIEDKVRTLPPLKNPANTKQSFDVLEVWGHIYKGNYRMRLIYARALPDQCVLMGQEILEQASL